jgi:hypothetical protein
MSKILGSVLSLLLCAGSAIAQNECSSASPPLFPVPTFNFTDSSGVVHQGACWNAATGQVTFPLTPGGGSGLVTSVFGRQGVVTAQNNDYASVPSLNLGDGSNSGISFSTANQVLFLTGGLATEMSNDGTSAAFNQPAGGGNSITDGGSTTCYVGKLLVDEFQCINGSNSITLGSTNTTIAGNLQIPGAVTVSPSTVFTPTSGSLVTFAAGTGSTGFRLSDSNGDVFTLGPSGGTGGTTLGTSNLAVTLTGTGNIQLGSSANVSYLMGANILWETAAHPTISSGFGTSPTVAHQNGSFAFEINVGTGGTASSGVIAFNTAAGDGWAVNCTDISTQSATVFLTKQTASSTTTATVTNYNTSGAAAAWAASDLLVCQATAF